MRQQSTRRMTKYILLVAILLTAGFTGTAYATNSSSTNYEVTDTQFGSSSASENCSAEYCAQATLGDMTTGSSSPGPSAATFSSVTSEEPLLEVIVDPGVSHLGVLSTESAATKTSIVRIRNQLSNGYVLQIMGDPPKYAGHTLHTSNQPVASAPGTELFGINVVANTTPSVGAYPEQVPSSETSFGFAEPGYDTPNLFKYQSGAVVARSQTQSGRTDFTISMVVNISNQTPAGRFTGDYAAVVIPVY